MFVILRHPQFPRCIYSVNEVLKMGVYYTCKYDYSIDQDIYIFTAVEDLEVEVDVNTV